MNTKPEVLPIEPAHVEKLLGLIKQPGLMAKIITLSTGFTPNLEKVIVERAGFGSEMFWGRSHVYRYYFPHGTTPSTVPLVDIAGFAIQALVCTDPFHANKKRQASIQIDTCNAKGQRNQLAGRNYLISEMLQVFDGNLLPHRL